MLGDQLSSRKHEKLLGVLIDHKWTFEDHFLNIVQKINQKIHILISIHQRHLLFLVTEIFKCISQINLEFTWSSFKPLSANPTK